MAQIQKSASLDRPSQAHQPQARQSNQTLPERAPRTFQEAPQRPAAASEAEKTPRWCGRRNGQGGQQTGEPCGDVQRPGRRRQLRQEREQEPSQEEQGIAPPRSKPAAVAYARNVRAYPCGGRDTSSSRGRRTDREVRSGGGPGLPPRHFRPPVAAGRSGRCASGRGGRWAAAAMAIARGEGGRRKRESGGTAAVAG